MKKFEIVSLRSKNRVRARKSKENHHKGQERSKLNLDLFSGWGIIIDERSKKVKVRKKWFP